jgi:hypothetical protein
MKEQQSTKGQQHRRHKPQPAQDHTGATAATQAHPLQSLQQTAGNAQIARLLEEDTRAVWARPEVGAAGGAVSNQLANRIYGRLGGGRSLDTATQARLGAALGANLGAVRIHDDAEANVLSLSVGASAFTLGNDIFFSQFASPTDEHVLKHELTHVIQQQSLPTGGTLTVGSADDAMEHEATAVAAAPIPHAVAAESAPPTVQRGLLDELNLGNISGIVGTGSSILQGVAELGNVPLAREMGTAASEITTALPGGTAIGGLTSLAGLYTGTRDMLDEDKPWYERGVGGMSAISGATGLAGTVSSMFGSSLFAAGGSAGLTAGAGSALTGGGAGLLSGAGAATALGSAGAVLGAGAAGYGAGRILDEGVGWMGQQITGDEQGDYTISGGLAGLMTAADQGVSSLWADPDRPAYTQTLGWKLAEWLD